MEIKEIFFRFCKENKILGDLLLLHMQHPTFGVYWNDGKIARKGDTFDDLVDRIFKSKYITLSEKLPQLISTIDYTSSDSDFYKNAIKKWKYFVRHNIIMDEDKLQDGNVIVCEETSGETKEYIEFVISNNNYCKIDKWSIYAYRKDADFKSCFKIPKTHIISVNGEKFNLRIKKNRKIYG